MIAINVITIFHIIVISYDSTANRFVGVPCCSAPPPSELPQQGGVQRVRWEAPLESGKLFLIVVVVVVVV